MGVPARPSKTRRLTNIAAKTRRAEKPIQLWCVPRGAILLETVICGIILGVIVSAIVPTLVWLARDRQNGRQQQAALLEVGNVMERLTLLDWDELTPERAAEFERAHDLRTQFPEARLRVLLTAGDAEPQGKHLLVELRWELARGRPAPPVRLAAWVYRKE